MNVGGVAVSQLLEQVPVGLLIVPAGWKLALQWQDKSYTPNPHGQLSVPVVSRTLCFHDILTHDLNLKTPRKYLSKEKSKG